jgi:acyl-CoA synthetase (NDP forming)
MMQVSEQVPPAALRALDVTPLMRPRSIGVVGVSASAGTIGNALVANLEAFAYRGEVHLVSRGRREVNGRACVPSIDELPLGLDVVVLCVPADVVVESVRACAGRQVKSVVVYAAGFAEAGEAGAAAQCEITRISEAAGMPVLGPNCLGVTNFVDGIPLSFGPADVRLCGDQRTLAVVAQSGGMMGNIRLASFARGVTLSHTISTGNEAGVGMEDFLAFLIDDVHTSAIAMFVEQVRRPQLFLRLLRAARDQGKPVILLHPGRSLRAQESAASHTGALAGDHAVMRTLVQACGAVLVETIEELIDAGWLLSKWPDATADGVGILTDSGAFKGFALDFAESIGLPLPELCAATCDALRAVLPSFSTASNPLDITAQGLREMDLYGQAARALLHDPGIGALSAVVMPSAPAVGLAKFRAMQAALVGLRKPVVYTVMGGDSPLASELQAEVRASGAVFFRSPERAMRALRHLVDHGRRRAAASAEAANSAANASSTAVPPVVGEGMLAEYQGKAWLAELGLPTPVGALAGSVDEALAIAARIGYPVVLKAQAAALPHKSDVGGVAVGIRDNGALRQAWQRMHQDVGRARPELALDGLLVEAMAASGGVEMILGAKRDAQWGPVLMIGLGGVWTELLNDVRLLPADASPETIRAELNQLRGAGLLQGARGAPLADVDALVAAVARIGAAFVAQPRLQELDVNPLFVYPRGQGVLALDAVLILS